MELMPNVGQGYDSRLNSLVADGALISQHSPLDRYFQYLAAASLISGDSLGLCLAGASAGRLRPAASFSDASHSRFADANKSSRGEGTKGHAGQDVVCIHHSATQRDNCKHKLHSESTLN